MAGKHVALLRGINVGGKHRLPMKQLVAIFESHGAEDVLTLIQSGNVVFRGSARLARSIAGAVAKSIEQECGFEAPVVVRSAAQFHAAIGACPFLPSGKGRGKAGDSAEHVHVGFCAKRPTAARIAALDPDRSPGDRFTVLGAEVYLHLPNGAARTKLTTAWFDSGLATTTTFRNWRTLERIAGLLA
ncbi:MAG: DUF1697 domain-containing protein [bacterium]|nr:DUF1697 domain-containing protein [bacterium]